MLGDGSEVNSTRVMTEARLVRDWSEIEIEARLKRDWSEITSVNTRSRNPRTIEWWTRSKWSQGKAKIRQEVGEQGREVDETSREGDASQHHSRGGQGSRVCGP